MGSVKGTRILSLAGVRELIPLSRSQIFRLERAGQFPSRIRIGMRRIGWFDSDIEEWLDGRRNASGAKAVRDSSLKSAG
ncbi:AlpA family phage regulatory protein [Mesorhizobium sp. M0771]|uniref:helix-turn-helix transcriptional regulator n=1 Tax=Mesorhizobium sp. M0771 TaxID=2956997 RepID=UPI00333C9227